VNTGKYQRDAQARN